MKQDDESILASLLHDLDIDSAVSRLLRVGFLLVAVPGLTNKYHQLNRSRDEGPEDIFIEISKHNHFIIQYAYNGQVAMYPEIITTWEQWVVFVRMLAVKHYSEPKKNLKEEQSEPLKCLE